jgi:hypothetical protein
MPILRTSKWPGFTLAGALAVLGVFVVGGAAGGVLCFAALAVFWATAIGALRGEDVSRIDGGGYIGGGGAF